MDINQVFRIAIILITGVFLAYCVGQFYTRLYSKLKIIFFLLACIAMVIRIVIPTINGSQIVIPTSTIQLNEWVSAIPHWEIIFHKIWIPPAILFLVFAASNKCPNCKSFTFKKIMTKPIDRYTVENRGSTRAESNNGYRKNYVGQTRIFVDEVSYICKKCGHEWCVKETTSKMAQSKLINVEREIKPPEFRDPY